MTIWVELIDWLFYANEHVSLWKLWNFAFVNGYGALVWPVETTTVSLK